MRILLLSEYFPELSSSNITGGIEARCLNIARFLSKKNEVVVLTSWKEGQKREEKSGKLKIIRTGEEHEYTNHAGFVSRIRLSDSLIKEGINLKKIDIVDGYNFTTYLPANRIAKKLGKPCIATYHETWVGEWVKNKGYVTGVPYEIYERLLLKMHFDKYISVSTFTKKRLVKNGIDEKKISVIPNGVSLKEFNTVSAEKSKDPAICFIGRLVDTKKVDVLIRAVGIIKEHIPKIKCKIIGKGPELQRLKQLTSDLGLKPYIEFLGFIEDTTKAREILKSCNILCHPGILEGFGITLIEGLALSLPYVCSDIPVFKEITENGKGGLFFKPEDYKDLAKKVVMLLKDKKLYEEKQEEAKSVVEKYDWENITRDVEILYNDVVEKYKSKV